MTKTKLSQLWLSANDTRRRHIAPRPDKITPSARQVAFVISARENVSRQYGKSNNKPIEVFPPYLKTDPLLHLTVKMLFLWIDLNQGFIRDDYTPSSVLDEARSAQSEAAQRIFICELKRTGR